MFQQPLVRSNPARDPYRGRGRQTSTRIFFCEGSYTGKGIYGTSTPSNRALAGGGRDDALLSHDFSFEGLFRRRAGLVTGRRALSRARPLALGGRPADRQHRGGPRGGMAKLLPRGSSGARVPADRALEGCGGQSAGRSLSAPSAFPHIERGAWAMAGQHRRASGTLFVLATIAVSALRPFQMVG